MSEPKPQNRVARDPVGSAPVAAGQFNFRAEPALMERVKEESDRAGMPVAEFIRQSLMFRIAYIVTRRGDANEAEAVLRRVVEGDES